MGGIESAVGDVSGRKQNCRHGTAQSGHMRQTKKFESVVQSPLSTTTFGLVTLGTKRGLFVEWWKETWASVRKISETV